jgi:hypothetical protein
LKLECLRKIEKEKLIQKKKQDQENEVKKNKDKF